MKKLRIWFMATFQDYPFWKVEYKTGEITHPLYYAEAKGLSKCFYGRLYIDYKYGQTYLNP